MRRQRGLFVLLGLMAIGSLGIAAFRGLSTPENANCVQIYFDPESRDQLASGKAFAQQLRGLLAPYVGYSIRTSESKKNKAPFS